MADDLNNLVKKTKARTILNRTLEKVVTSMTTAVSDRIFIQGKTATGSQIGTYSKGYQATRRRGVIYPKKGVKKNVSYPISSKVILQATQQMKNDWSPIVQNGEYGSGFKNEFNFKKSKWVENTYKKEIFDLTNNEKKLLNDLLEKETQKYLNGIK